MALLTHVLGQAVEKIEVSIVAAESALEAVDVAVDAELESLTWPHC